MVPGSRKYRILYTAWGFLECLSFGGLIYGWGSFVFVLKEEGLYLDLCPSYSCNHLNDSVNASSITKIVPENQSATAYSTGSNFSLATSCVKADCPERENRLTLAFTIAMAMFCVGCFILGQINFKFGIRMTRLTAAAVFIVGALMLAFMSNDVPYLIFPGLSMIGAGGIGILVTNLQLSALFPRGGSVIVGLMCGGFDASSGVQLLVKIGHENGISRRTSYIILACVHLLTLVSTFFFLPKKFFKKPGTSRSDEVANDKDAGAELTGKGAEEDEPEDPKPSLRSCMLSPIYILHVLWLSMLQLRFYFFLGSMNSMLGTLLLQSQDKVSHYTNVFMYILMCGLFTSPLAGVVCDFFNRFFATSQSATRRTLMPLVIPIALTTTLCLIMSALILSNDATTLYAVFVFLLFFRSFMYTLAAGLIGSVFPGEYFGLMYGILILVGGILSMFQYALFTWSEASGVQQVNFFLVALMVISYGHPFYLWLTCRIADTSGSFSLVKK